MRNWIELHDRWRITRKPMSVWRTVLVVGNGPSRVNRAQVVHNARSRAWIIGCNAGYCLDPMLPPAEIIVAYDGAQANLVAHGYMKTYAAHVPDPIMVVPEQRETCVQFDEPAHLADRIFEAKPHVGTVEPGVFANAKWNPLDARAYGNLSGLLAYQVALLCGAERVFLLGMDCGGRLAGDQVELSAVGKDVPGYDHGDVPASSCAQIGEAYLPPQWGATRSLWRALTKRAEELGTQTFLAAPGGALDWLTVHTP